MGICYIPGVGGAIGAADARNGVTASNTMGAGPAMICPEAKDRRDQGMP